MRNRQADHHHYLPPPTGVHHEQRRSTTETLKMTLKQDPDYARWVLFHAEAIMQRLDEWHQDNINPRHTELKEELVKLLLGARELLYASNQNQKLAALLQRSFNHNE